MFGSYRKLVRFNETVMETLWIFRMVIVFIIEEIVCLALANEQSNLVAIHSQTRIPISYNLEILSFDVAKKVFTYGILHGPDKPLQLIESFSNQT